MKTLVLFFTLLCSSLFSQSVTIGDYWLEQTTLHWTTTQENKVDKFLPQYSYDGLNWFDMGFVDAYGNSNTLRSYQFYTMPFYSVTHYRLLVRYYGNVEEQLTANWKIVRSNNDNGLTPTENVSYQYFDLSGRLCSTGSYLIKR